MEAAILALSLFELNKYHSAVFVLFPYAGCLRDGHGSVHLHRDLTGPRRPAAWLVGRRQILPHTTTQPFGQTSGEFQ